MPTPSKPLTAPLRDIAAKSNGAIEQTLLSRPSESETARPSPPSSRPSRMPLYHPPAPLHALPRPDGPDRSLIEEPPPPMGKDKPPRLVRGKPTDPAFKAKVVAYALEEPAKGGKRTKLAVAEHFGIKSSSLISKWIAEARAEANGKATPKRKSVKTFVSDDVKAAAVARVLEGGEMQVAVAKDLHIVPATLSLWVRRAKEAAAAPASKRGPSGGDDLKSLARELTEAMEQVERIKKKLRKLLA